MRKRRDALSRERFSGVLCRGAQTEIGFDGMSGAVESDFSRKQMRDRFMASEVQFVPC
jgi:hypothetical protein